MNKATGKTDCFSLKLKNNASYFAPQFCNTLNGRWSKYANITMPESVGSYRLFDTGCFAGLFYNSLDSALRICSGITCLIGLTIE